ncbi:extracellular solute-binding protein [Paenibacillus filicis]|uniref:Extracellular solute-binding protein n=1 Tax=Paenibacillus filicis TaxID=669464 RepID=A0ABU9DQ73_9BACL
MKLTHKKMFASAVAVTLLSSTLAACGGDTPSAQQPSDGSSPKANTEERTVRMMLNLVGGKKPDENPLFEKEIERLTKIKATIDKPASDFEQKLMAAIAGGEKYDLLQTTKGTMNKLIDQGALTPLDDMIKNSKVLSNPDVVPAFSWDTVKGEDGKIYGVTMKDEGGTLITVRNDWLKKLNLPDPKTLDDYYNVMKAFAEQDPDGNGKKDTYGLSLAGSGSAFDLQPFFSAAGLKQRYVKKDGKLDVPYSTDAAIPIYEWLHKLYKEGLLDPNFATNDTSKMRNMMLTDRAGMVVYWDGWVSGFNSNRKIKDPNTTFQVKGLPGIPGPDGKYILRRGDPDVWSIPVNAVHPKTAFEFIEFWHSPDGHILGSLGILNEDYTVKDGKYELTPAGKEHNGDHGAPGWHDKTFVNPLSKDVDPKSPEVEAVNIIKTHSTPEYSPPKQWPDAEKIINSYGLKAILGELPAADAVKQMRKELKDKKLID